MTNRPASIGEAPRTDRRILKSKKALRDALVELIQEKGYDAVSVEEITQRANVGRATFYLHYKDKEELLLEEFIEMAKDRVQALSQIPVSVWEERDNPVEFFAENQPMMPLQKVFEHAAENAGLYRVLLRGESSPRLAERIRRIVATSINEIAEATRQKEPIPVKLLVPIELLAAYFSGALLSSLSWWLHEEQPPSPSEMTRMFQSLFFPGVRRIIARAPAPGGPSEAAPHHGDEAR
jgi:AcrR family transcriptional regulator